MIGVRDQDRQMRHQIRVGHEALERKLDVDRWRRGDRRQANAGAVGSDQASDRVGLRFGGAAARRDDARGHRHRSAVLGVLHGVRDLMGDARARGRSIGERDDVAGGKRLCAVGREIVTRAGVRLHVAEWPAKRCSIGRA